MYINCTIGFEASDVGTPTKCKTDSSCNYIYGCIIAYIPEEVLVVVVVVVRGGGGGGGGEREEWEVMVMGIE